jgi:hypothetical protein
MAQPLSQLTFWSTRLNWQLRVSASASVEFDGEQVNAAWERVRQSRASSDYLSTIPPGQVHPTSLLPVTNKVDSLEKSPFSNFEF